LCGGHPRRAGKILISQRFDRAHGGMWELPGGKVEAGETKSIRLHFSNCTILEGEPQPLDVADLRWVEPSQLADFQFSLRR
jgi:hypothetical protein